MNTKTSSPAEKKFTYFVSFYSDKGYGNCVFDTDREIKSSEDLDVIHKMIFKDGEDRFGRIVILNFIKL